MGGPRREFIRAIHLPEGSRAAASFEADPFCQPMAVLFLAMMEARGLDRIDVAYPGSFWDDDVVARAWSDQGDSQLTIAAPANRWRALPPSSMVNLPIGG